MPTYEYECLDCDYKFEKFQMMSEDPLKVCPRCGGRLRRLIGAGAGVIFKGNGFYQTDYKGSKSKEGGVEKDEENSEEKKKNKEESN